MPMHSPAHPGRLISRELTHLKVSVAFAAQALGVTRSQLYRVISGDSAISPEMAVRLEQVIGSTADQWLRLQMAYDLSKVRQTQAIRLERLPRPAVA